MKKITLTIITVLVASIMFAATPDISAMCKILINSQSSISGDNIKMLESASFSSAHDNGWDGTKNIIAGNLQMWVPSYQDLATIATNELDNTPITVQTIADTEYTFSFSNVKGTQLMLLDAQNDSLTVINGTNTYKCAIAANKTIAGRFFVVKAYTPDPGNLEVCHVGDELQVKNNPFSTNIVVKNAEGTKVVDRMPVNTPQIISLKDLPKGRYTVEFNDGKEVFVISVKPDVKPAN